MLRRQAANYLCFCIYSSVWFPLIWKKSEICIFERFAFASKTADSDVAQPSPALQRQICLAHFIFQSTLQVTCILSGNVGCCWQVPKLNWWGHQQFDNWGVTYRAIVQWKFQCNENPSLQGKMSALLHHAKQMAQSNKINCCILVTSKQNLSKAK